MEKTMETTEVQKPDSLGSQESLNGKDITMKTENEEKDPYLMFPTIGEHQNSDGFTKMPYFSGNDHGTQSWKPYRPNGKKLEKKLTNEWMQSGLRMQDLSLPSSNVYMNPVMAPTNEAEWAEMATDHFDDIYPSTYQPDHENTRTWVARRTETENAYFGGDGLSVGFVPRPRIACGEDRFMVRLVSDSFALATLVKSTTETEAQYKAISEDSQNYALMSQNRNIENTIKAATTSKEIDVLLVKLGKALTSAVDQGEKETRDSIDKWVSMAVEVRNTLRKKECEKEEETLDKEKEDEIETTETETEIETEVETEVELEAAPLIDTLSVEKESVPYDSTRVLACAGYSISPDCGGRYMFDVDGPNVDAVDEFAPTVDLDDDGKEITRFQRITDERIKGHLWCLNMQARGNVKWRPLKCKVAIPGTFSSNGEHEILSVDQERAIILNMPRGNPTGEEYWFIDCNRSHVRLETLSNAERVLKKNMPVSTKFKAVFSSLTDTHVAILGYRKDKNSPTLYIFNRSVVISDKVSDDEVKTEVEPEVEPEKKNALVINSDVPITAITLSIRTPGTLWVGFKDGSLVQLNCDTGDSCGESMWSSAFAPLTCIVEKGSRVLASSSMGMHLFKTNSKDTDEKIIHMALSHNVSFDLRGNLLVLQKSNNAVQFVNAHTLKMESVMAEPKEGSLNPPPPEITTQQPMISLCDDRITVMHLDGSRRIIDFGGWAELQSRGKHLKGHTISSTEAERKATFAPDDVVSGKKSSGKKKKKKKKKKNGKK